MASPKASRKPISDWEAIEEEYRSGLLSIRELGRQFDCSDTAIRKRAKTYGWKRDLSKKVRDEVRSRMVRSEVRTSNATDREIVDAAAETRVRVIELQRKDIKQLRELENKLLKELSGKPTKLYITQYQGDIIQKVVALTVSERSQAANNLANVQHKRIALERQAFGIDETSATTEDVLTEIPIVAIAAPCREDE